MIRTVGAIAAGVVAAGTAVIGLGTAFTAAGVVAAGLSAAIGTIGSVVSAAIGVITTIGGMLAPVALPILGIAAAIVGVGYALYAGISAWVTYTDSGKAAMNGIMGLVGSFVGQVRGMINQAIATVMPFVDVFRDTIGGMVDAFMAGDLGLAATVAMTGVQLAFEMGKSLIVGIWLDLKERVIGVWDSIMVGASGAAGFISSLFSSAMNAVFQSSFSSQMLAGWEVFREAAKAALEYVIDFAQDVYDTFMNIARAIRSVVGLVVANAPMIAKAAQQKAREVFVAQAPPAAVTAIDQAMEAGGKAMEATRERQGAARDERQANREEFNTKQDAKIVALQQELAALTEKASQQRQEMEAKRAADRAKSGIGHRVVTSPSGEIDGLVFILASF